MSNREVDLSALSQWRPPAHWRQISVLDAHTGGEPLRIILAGFPEPVGQTILERRRFLKAEYDFLRRSIIFEPRGHADQYAALLMPPAHRDADCSVLFLHNEGYSTMCGHAIIALSKILVESGAVPMTYPETKLTIEVPAGLISSYAHCQAGEVTSVRFHNMPSFVLHANKRILVDGLGEIGVDVAFGGAFYAYVDAAECGFDLIKEEYGELIRVGRMIKEAVAKALPIIHPLEEDLSFLYGTIFMGAPHHNGTTRNVCIFADGEVDRSPTGSGVAGRLALHYSRGEIELGEQIVVESLLDSCFAGKVVSKTRLGEYSAVIPEVSGQAWITGRSEFCFDPSDPMSEGFLLR